MRAPIDNGGPVAAPFQQFFADIHAQVALRARITAACRAPEPECVAALLPGATLPEPQANAARLLARELVVALRRKKQDGGGGVAGLIHEYSLSSQEGVALMCLAEALLRIPDSATRDALIRDKISTADWQAHLGNSPSLFVNAATWGLLITGKLTTTSSEGGLTAAITRLIGKGGEPLIRKGVDLGLRMMGEQFVTGQTIAEALENSRAMEAKGFRYSYDCLGEAATTAADAERYFRDYEAAIHAIGTASNGRGIYEGPGISVKLSALHPRYSRAQYARVMDELLPRLSSLVLLARQYDIALNIDAEESDRLEISLDLLEALCADPHLAGWNGIGFVLQAYQKRCPHVIAWIIELARRTQHRLMVRLVKGAYWDSEIKRAQVDGLADFPVYTRKIHTDVSYLSCARLLLAAPDAVFPQFATHNAHTLSTVMQMGGGNFYAGQYEFQCLHGMGEPLYEEVVGEEKLRRPCRIYAPVGTHETLLAYLVRRLLENGANTSFVNRIADEDVSIDELVEDPVDIARAINPLGAPHPKIALPGDIFGAERRNSTGLDLSSEQTLAALAVGIRAELGDTQVAVPQVAVPQVAVPLVAGHAPRANGAAGVRELRNPADRRDLVGQVTYATAEDIDAACAAAQIVAREWAATQPAARAQMLARAADLMEARTPALMALIVREAGKSLPNAVSEIREAVDFLRYYGVQVCIPAGEGANGAASGVPLGPIACISPWNFPLAIFTGQVAAALAAGNPVLAKPAEETPLIAAAAVRLLREAGIPEAVVQLLPGAGEVGAALVADARVCGVMFTGSTAVARLIQRQLADRLSAAGTPVPLIAETGGQNALIVDSSALPEQVVYDVLASAFDSAGQRCSALRILCLQEDIADHVLTMLKGALRELQVGNPDRLTTDVGPVITDEARATITAHIDTMRKRGHAVEQLPLPAAAALGTFVPPTMIEINRIGDVEREVFGPVLHVLRYERADLPALIDAINATGYALTFGLHTRIDETIAMVTERVAAGNIYVNRNIIGAVVGVQPFGGNGLSGTGPKAGGPLYLKRLCPVRIPPGALAAGTAVPAVMREYIQYLQQQKLESIAVRVAAYANCSRAGEFRELPGPVGERNVYVLKPRGRILVLAAAQDALLMQIGAALATGNVALVEKNNAAAKILAHLPASVAARIQSVAHWQDAQNLAAILHVGDRESLQELNRVVARRAGPIVLVQGASVAGFSDGSEDYALEPLLEEVSVSTNTAAAGGNANLMTIG
ncbi:MAG: trifunctional transcriptional regulator/proline dehydrogenase/L-glutamate gamma-semialdehyde dehydrogenase [Steroidobacteraceae bacterium]